MRERPTDLGDEDVAAALTAGWGLDGVALEWTGVGFGGHHWWATAPDNRRWFVSAHDLSDCDSDSLERSFREAGRLARSIAGLVVPVPSTAGTAGIVWDGRWFVTVQPEAPGANLERWEGLEAPVPLATALAELHQALPGEIECVDLRIEGRGAIGAALGGRARWCDPHGSVVRGLIEEHRGALEESLGTYDELCDAARRRPWVPTHGEPHPGNVLVHGGRVSLIDWDTLRLAPVERDLWCVAGAPGVLDAYVELTGAPVCEDGLARQQLWWQLSDIGWGIERFCRPHTGGADDAETLVSVERALAQLAD